MKRIPTLMAASAIALSGGSASAAVFDFDIVVEFTQAFLDFDAATVYDFAADFAVAEATWEGFFSGRHAANADDATLRITADLPAIDGPFGILGQAGPRDLICSDGTFDISCAASQFDDRYIIGRSGIMQFDNADAQRLADDGLFDDVILHEMAHVMGHGTLWELNALYEAPDRPQFDPNDIRPANTEDGQYIGQFGVAAYNAEFDLDEDFVPVEGNGGPGTADAHWDEEFAGGGAEIMTGFLDPNGVYISNTTIESFRDLGFVVAEDDDPNVIPLPAGGWLILTGFGALAVSRRRKKP